MIKNIIIYIVLIGTASLSMRSCQKQKQEREVAERNIEALVADIERYKTESGKDAVIIQGLEIGKRSLSKINAELAKELEDTKIKLENAMSVVQIKTEYKYRNIKDTIPVYISDSITKVNINEPFLMLSLEIDNKKDVINPDKLTLHIPNKQIIAPEFKYKGWWIFKKKRGVQITVVNSNPYIETSEGFYVDFKK